MVKKLAYFCIALSLLWRLVRFLVEFPVWGDEAMVAVNFFDSKRMIINHATRFLYTAKTAVTDFTSWRLVNFVL